MNQRLLIGIIIIAGIGSIGSVLAYSGSISAAQGNFNNVLVTGTCSGCGGEGNFNTWSLVVDLNQSATINTPDISYVSNIGSVYSGTASGTNIVLINGTLIQLSGTNVLDKNFFTQHVESTTGEYVVTRFHNGTGYFVNVFKNDVLKTTFAIDSTKFSTPGLSTWEISPNGKYISLAQQDVCGCGNLRAQIWQGS